MSLSERDKARINLINPATNEIKLGDIIGNVQLSGATAGRKQFGYLFNGDIGLMRWRSALAKVANGDLIANVNVIGSSSVVGFGSSGGGVAGNLDNSSTWLTKGFVGRLRSKFAATYGDVGRGFVPHNNYHFYPTWTGTWTDLNDYGVLGVKAKKSTVAGSSVTIRFNGTSLTLVAVSGSNGAGFTVAIDGGTAQSYTTAGENVAAKEFVIATGLEDKQHTAVITVSATTAPKGLSIIGHYEGKAATAGVRVNTIGVSGSKTSAALGEGFLFTEIDMWVPALTVISYSSNDYNAQTPLAQFKAQTQTLVTRAKSFGDVILVPAGMRGSKLAVPVESYIAVYKELAEENGVAFLDTHGRWNSDFNFAKNTLQFIASDDIHMNDYGHQDIANGLYNALVNY